MKTIVFAMLLAPAIAAARLLLSRQKFSRLLDRLNQTFSQ